MSAKAPIAGPRRTFRMSPTCFGWFWNSGEAGAKYHAVAEEGVPLRAIAETIGGSLGVPVTSLTADEAQAHFGPSAMFMGLDLMASSAITREQLGWRPAGPSLITDLERIDA